ncbi:hypothetical protein MAC_06326 [Metarhizium acridum CQMa 102]|uniref:Aminoglycoside phosphotransferase domain-containing protein n=1 Tax=Metarhizium acridum (strain CQMa 102) TaxID=655827 RepID=E9E8X8_METAQ|nr:uncharacterized protein MAC_06326 [Metarhizium acridum CQMa 102]EFY87614.1 hypothetical protein MAC_06326 [Metarhizium acridum CQMa 102]
MCPTTPAMLNARREKDCVGITHERKYYSLNGSFVKRSLRPSEWQHNPFAGTLSIPRFGNERLLNEAAALRFIADNTDIPVPKLYGCFEDDNAIYLVTELIDGVKMADLEPEQRKSVEPELEGYVNVLRGLKSSVWGGPSGIVSSRVSPFQFLVLTFSMQVIPPYRIMVESHRITWKMKPRESSDLVFCHNDFSAHNVIVDPVSLKVKAVLDWEYAGFYPQEFESEFFRRPGPSVALDGERNDVTQLLEIMYQNEE